MELVTNMRYRDQYHYMRTILMTLGVLGLGHMSFWQSILLMNSVKTDAILGR
jgi:hypothetical protein